MSAPHPYAPRPYAPIPDALRRGLVFAPDLATGDDSISGRRGTGTAVTYSATTEASTFVAASNSRIVWSTPYDLTASPLSFACWINPSSTVSEVTYLFEIRVTATTDPALVVHLTGTATLRLQHERATSDTHKSGPTVITGSTWWHVAVTYGTPGSQASVTLYVNGVAESVAAASDGLGTIVEPSGDMVSGGLVGAGNDCGGQIRQPMVWHRALGAAEVASLAALPRPA